jgi:hypothetical protein
MRNAIAACLWFWAVLLSFASDFARWYHYPITGLVLNGISVVIFGFTAWFYYWGYKRVKDQTGTQSSLEKH